MKKQHNKRQNFIKRTVGKNRPDLPASWTNYIGVEDMCAVVNHTAGGYVFYVKGDMYIPAMHATERIRGNAY
ncbi:MAG: hypothetical protein LUF35_02150 [Lachnospiraceae bacterium]|nr:hypothetical protein [Lachnospiraceae bacterium]